MNVVIRKGYSRLLCNNYNQCVNVLPTVIELSDGKSQFEEYELAWKLRIIAGQGNPCPGHNQTDS